MVPIRRCNESENQANANQSTGEAETELPVSNNKQIGRKLPSKQATNAGKYPCPEDYFKIKQPPSLDNNARKSV